MRAFVLNYPIAAGLGLLLLASVFRLIDIFVLRLDETWGEIILSKTAACVLSLGFFAATGGGLAAAGFHTRAVLPSVLMGIVITAVALLSGYALEMALQSRSGQAPELSLMAIDPKSALAGAAGFALLLMVGNLVNSFAEEGLFRGALIPLLRRELDLTAALLVSALLFGAWHLPWAIKAIWHEGSAPQEPMAWSLLANLLPQALLGLVWGYLYVRTGNIWGAWVSHTLTNSAVNFLHVRSAAGIDPGMSIRMATFTLVMLLGLLLIQRLSDAYGLPSVAPWGSS